MKFSLVVCTYMRPQAILNLLKSVKVQTLYPNEILIIDGSINAETQSVLKQYSFENLEYHKVHEKHRGLTKQRNFGVSKVNKTSEVICFLDDDTQLDSKYFETVVQTFKTDNAIIGVGGVATNENRWYKADVSKTYNSINYYQLDDFVIKEGLRNRLRNLLSLQSPLLPNKMPNFSHGRTCGYPLNGKNHEVDLLIGMSFSFRATVFNNIGFSSYFEGYGLYEDADFCLRALRFGKNVITTKAQLQHFHDASGRPNMYKYGKMVIRNGWYVWRLKYPNPSFKARFKWYIIHLLLIVIRFLNCVTTNKRKEAFNDAIGRIAGWWSLLFIKPNIEY
jgi:GT2 family glycosyltransferase